MLTSADSLHKIRLLIRNEMFKLRIKNKVYLPQVGVIIAHCVKRPNCLLDPHFCLHSFLLIF